MSGLMSDTSCVISDSTSDAPQEHFPGWHPLKSDWLEGLAAEIKQSAQYAQQCLVNNGRTDKELAEAIAQIKKWQKTHPELFDNNSPDIIIDEKLGAQLTPGTFADFLSAQEFSGALKPYEFAALALLQEASGLADLDVVAKKDSLSIGAQHLTFKIARLHTTVVLLRMLDNNPERRTLVQDIMAALFGSETPQL
jgi:hypothetical protein